MKSFGMVRRVDELGRFVLPAELRKTMGIREGDSMEVFTEKDTIIMRKYQPGDVFTGEMDDLIEFYGRKVSIKSIIEMAKIAGLNIQQ